MLKLTDGGISDSVPLAFAQSSAIGATHVIVSDCRWVGTDPFNRYQHRMDPAANVQDGQSLVAAQGAAVDGSRWRAGGHSADPQQDSGLVGRVNSCFVRSKCRRSYLRSISAGRLWAASESDILRRPQAYSRYRVLSIPLLFVAV